MFCNSLEKKGIFYGKHVSLPDVVVEEERDAPWIFHDFPELAGTATLDQCQGRLVGAGSKELSLLIRGNPWPIF